MVRAHCSGTHHIALAAPCNLPPNRLHIANDRARLIQHAIAQFSSRLDGDDQRNNEAVKAERRTKTPDKHHANVQLGLPSGVLHTNLACHAERKSSSQIAESDGQTCGGATSVRQREKVAKQMYIGTMIVSSEGLSLNLPTSTISFKSSLSGPLLQG